MKKILIFTYMFILLIWGTSCKKFLDINSDPDTPQQPSNSSVLPQCLASIPTALQSDGGTYVAKYIQNWLTGSSANQNAWDLQGYSWSGGTAAQTWQMTYYALGNNLTYMMDNAAKQNLPEYMGVALALRAWAFQHTTDYNCDIPFYSAFNPNLSTFHYDSQDTIYRGIDSICHAAITYLNVALSDPNSGSRLAIGDMVYSGNVSQWKKFVYGILARNYNHLSNKSFYKPDSVIAFCDSSFTSVNDDFDVPFDATQNGNANYFGTYRNNMGTLRQSNYIVNLLDGLILAGDFTPANRDPRLSQMLVCSNDTTNGNGGYRGVDPGQGDPYYSLNSPSTYLVNGLPPTSGSALTNYTNSKKKVAIAWGDSLYANTAVSNFSLGGGKYLFKNKAVFPVMTYAEIKFIKAEAEFKKGDKADAYVAYLAGINGHFDFINRSYSGIRSADNIYNVNQITAAQRTAYLTGRNVKQIADSLHLTDIMLQKYIAMWGWGFIESWADLRRYHYVDIDAETGQQVYKGFNFPVPFFANNNGLPVYRVRPHFTSEYTYDVNELIRVGATTSTFHTLEMWFSKPDSADNP